MAFIKEYENAIPKSLCASIIKKLENDEEMKPGETAEGVNTCIKNTSDFSINDEIIKRDDFWEVTDKILCQTIQKYLKKYISEYIGPEVFNLNPRDTKNILQCVFNEYMTFTQFQIQKYTPGCYFKPHIDDTLKPRRRMVAIIFYLNDVDPSDGGSTRFYNGREVTPETGKLLLFPSTWTYLHQGTELKKGVKYIITSFCCSPPYQ